MSPARRRPATERRPLLYFHTSNTDKFLQARHLADQAGVNIRQFRAGREPYDEDYELGSQGMLTRALDQVVSSVGKGALVFVEDTSVRIEALSTEDKDVPGLAVKEWFKATTFEELDAALARAGGDRRVVVRSDIALRVPGLATPVFFHGESAGTVATAPPAFAQDLDHPWLTPHTFNGWFVPDGETAPLGALPIAQAEPLDFRARAIRMLLARLAEYTAVLNLGSAGYRRRAAMPGAAAAAPMLLPPPQVIVVGRTCAGKTTLAEHAASRHEVHRIEASAVVRELIDELGTPAGVPRDAGINDVALALLRERGMDSVSRRILGKWGTDLDAGFVISGLRTIEEIALLRRVIPTVHIVRVDAPEPVRFARHLARRRPGHEQTIEEFRSRDAKQDDFGLLPVARELADHFIDNVGTKDEYIDAVDQLLDRMHSPSAASSAETPRHTRLSRALMLLVANGPMLLPDIQAEAALGQGNASRVLGNAPTTTLRDKDGNGRDRWQVSPTGLAYLEVLGHLPGDSTGT